MQVWADARSGRRRRSRRGQAALELAPGRPRLQPGVTLLPGLGGLESIVGAPEGGVERVVARRRGGGVAGQIGLADREPVAAVGLAKEVIGVGRRAARPVGDDVAPRVRRHSKLAPGSPEKPQLGVTPLPGLGG